MLKDKCIHHKITLPDCKYFSKKHMYLCPKLNFTCFWNKVTKSFEKSCLRVNFLKGFFVNYLQRVVLSQTCNLMYFHDNVSNSNNLFLLQPQQLTTCAIQDGRKLKANKNIVRLMVSVFLY